MKLEILIVDANVLIDFCSTERSVLSLVTEHLATVHVAEQVLSEVKDLDRAGAEALGINVLAVKYPLQAAAAEASARSALAFADWLCLLVAEQQGWTCVTNDKRLRAECEARRVATLWGMQLLLRLVESDVLSAAEATRIAEAIGASNKRVPAAVLTSFRRKVLER